MNKFEPLNQEILRLITPAKPNDTVHASIGWLVSAVDEKFTEIYLTPLKPTHEHVVKAAVGCLVVDGFVRIEIDSRDIVMVILNKDRVEDFVPDCDNYREAVLQARIARLEETMKRHQDRLWAIEKRP